MNINDALISSAITSGVYILYKTIQHYRLKSECNRNNQLVVEIVDVEASNKPSQNPNQNPNITPVSDNPV